MTGLKSGSGDDLWDEDTNGDENNTTDVENSSASKKETASTEKTSKPSPTEPASESNHTTAARTPPSEPQPYIVRRALQDKSVQFERDERLTFFVHDEVVTGERKLITDFESMLGRSIPKFDIREAVYRAALQNRDDILNELMKMGYKLDDD